eukprot:gnl/TRDRNA2_/TRDRNA2_81494_c0_seq1.p1 gnl/TRDRNA2_/TRDRNA2_81494_c0~~gnl/TRDRNA2_/TRDRNA2_81494_c0_seq1.p1  ORF type:complete len:223 (-),score=30.73 gnl/TRDRNA2_/TRDRNA2_81494_c0_seq1:94-762(-)
MSVIGYTGAAIGLQPDPRSIHEMRKSAEERETERACWMDVTDELPSTCPYVEISGATGMFAGFTIGGYVLMPPEFFGAAPCWQTLPGTAQSERYLYYAHDGRYRVGSAANAEKREPDHGSLRSEVVDPGCLPHEAGGWELRLGYSQWESVEGLSVAAKPLPEGITLPRREPEKLEREYQMPDDAELELNRRQALAKAKAAALPQPDLLETPEVCPFDDPWAN